MKALVLAGLGAAGLALALALYGLVLAGPAGGPASPAVSPASGLARTEEGGQVAVTLTPLGGSRFSVALETHSVDLDGYDLAKLATLEDRGGNRVSPSSWEKSGSGHHVGGTLGFPASGEKGALDLKGPVAVTLRSVGGVDRTFRWEGGIPP